MRAVVWTRYGPPEGLEIQEVPTPSPRDNEVLIKIRATTAAAGDCELRSLNFSFGLRVLVRLLMGLSRPRRKILGQELAGEVEAVGRAVTLFGKGDRVFGTTGIGFGAYAEYICLPERSRGRALARMADDMTFVEAATVPTGGLEALHFLSRAGNLAGTKVLIIGAGGGIGTFAVQIAKHFGAEVTGVDTPAKLNPLLSIGADHVIDCTREDRTGSEERYDVIFDVVGQSPFSASLATLSREGRYLLGNPRLSARLRGTLTSPTSRKKVIAGASTQRTEDLVILRGLIESGKIRAVVDSQFPLERIREAHRRVEAGLAFGKVAITL
ncbi:MAG: NAD(P)-dependent alcohol dehydrogenase [Thermoplasmata archaeon]|nr:NAD(P)-dependent alcohol dehydrogenase [Thermoplasmata archaeon]